MKRAVFYPTHNLLDLQYMLVDSWLNCDANASYGLSHAVKSRIDKLGIDFHNPNSIHRGGQQARSVIESARTSIAHLINAPSSSRIVFTSGATEANNTALSIPVSYSTANRELVHSAIEHPSVSVYAERLEARGVRRQVIPVMKNGLIDQDLLRATVTSATSMVSIIWANNEIGTVQDISALTRTIREVAPHTLIHSDAVQVLGKHPLDFAASGLDLLTLSAHKVGGLTGVGALVVGSRVPFEPLLAGGAQELYHRAGTENVLGIASFGFAAEEIAGTLDSRISAMAQSRHYLYRLLTQAIPDLHCNTPLDSSLPNTLNVRFAGIRADDLVVAMDRVAIGISSGAACASGKPLPSAILMAIGLSPEAARESIRISLRADHSREDLDRLADQLILAVQWMRTSQTRCARVG
jgi:cysteine desulfurase